MIYEPGVHYEAEDGEAAKLVGEVAGGRLAPVFVRLHFRDEGSTVVSFERAHPESNAIDCKDWSGSFIDGMPCDRVEAVTLENPWQRLDRDARYEESSGEQPHARFDARNP